MANLQENILDMTIVEINYGYIYCFSNLSMPGILKIGMTERTPEVRLKEANTSDTWRPPTPYKIEFAKKVANPFLKETIIHTLLEQYTERINLKREFFKVSVEEVFNFFNLMDGEFWVNNNENNKEEDDEEEDEEEEDEEEEVKGCRDMKKCFINNQLIRHKIGINKIWIGIYDISKNVIIVNQNKYDSLSGMAKAHIKSEKPNRKSPNANGWKECECEIKGKWISTFNLKSLN